MAIDAHARIATGRARTAPRTRCRSPRAASTRPWPRPSQACASNLLVPRRRTVARLASEAPTSVVADAEPSRARCSGRRRARGGRSRRRARGCGRAAEAEPVAEAVLSPRLSPKPSREAAAEAVAEAEPVAEPEPEPVAEPERRRRARAPSPRRARRGRRRSARRGRARLRPSARAHTRETARPPRPSTLTTRPDRAGRVLAWRPRQEGAEGNGRSTSWSDSTSSRTGRAKS